MNSAPSTPSPCINICELDEDNICTGCYRSSDEVAAWLTANDEQKRRILENANRRKPEEVSA